MTLDDLPAVDQRSGQGSDIVASEINPTIIEAAIHGETLYTLFSDGRLQAWSQDSESGHDIEVPAPVRSFCVLGDELVLVTFDQGSRVIRQWAGLPGSWSVLLEFTESENDGFLALDCGGAQPIILSSSAIRFPHESKAIKIPAITPFATFTTLRHNEFLYVGLNAGEWGGGLLRLPLDGGVGQQIDNSDPAEICGGLLNTKCDPVNGLAADPVHPDCVLATIGLVHFSPSGSVVRICGDTVSLVYAKPYTPDPNWKFDPEEKAESFYSVAFYSLGTSAGGVWGVANDGIYRFGTETEPVFRPFPTSMIFPKSGVDWSNPEFVLILTTMHKRYSVSGGSLILVPR